MRSEPISVDGIRVGGRHRAALPDAVDRLADSMEKIGLLTPITVHSPDESAVYLVAGRHRLEAAKKLGWEDIDAFVVTGSDIDFELREIAENLHRAELTALERSEQIARWAELTAAKVVQIAPPGGNQPAERGIRKVAKGLGIEKTDVIRAVKVAAIAPEAKAAARAAGLDNNRAALLEAAKEKTPAAQVTAIKAIAALKQETRKKKKSRGPRFVVPKTTPEQREDFDLQGLEALWENASDNARAAFLKSVRPPPACGRVAICVQVREAIYILSGQPPAHEVAEWFAGTDGASLVSENLSTAAAWLAELNDAWKDEQ